MDFGLDALQLSIREGFLLEFKSLLNTVQVIFHNLATQMLLLISTCY